MFQHLVSHLVYLAVYNDRSFYTVSGEKVPLYSRIQLSHLLVDLYNFCTIGNNNEHIIITCNLLI